MTKSMFSRIWFDLFQHINDDQQKRDNSACFSCCYCIICSNKIINMKKMIPALIAITAMLMQFVSYGQDIPVNKFDQRGIEAINKFMAALSDNASNEQDAAKAAMPFIHRSEYDKSGTNLMRDRLDFSFKKAWQNVNFYRAPVSITRIQKQNLTAIGFGATAQAGTSYKVWIAKKEGVNGMPAPLSVFFPADGSAPTLHSYGSL